MRSRAPIFDNRLSYTPGRVSPLAYHDVELTGTFSHVNTWAQMPGYFFDGEWSRWDIKAAFGLGAATEVSLDVGLLRRSGGYLDGFIESFHQLFGITQSRRLDYPNNRLRVATGRTAEPQHVWLNDASAGTGVANPVVAVKKTLWAPAPPDTRRPQPVEQKRQPTLAADVAIKLPLGSLAEQFASPRITVLVDIALQQPIKPWLQVFATYGLMLSPGTDHIYGMPLSEVQKFLMLAFVFRVATNWAIAAQYLNQDGIVETADFVPMERTTHEFGLGVKWAPWQKNKCVLQAGLIENSVHDANTPDFGFTLGVRWRL